MNIITGYGGEPHVTAPQDRQLNAGILSEYNYVLSVGNQFAYEIESANSVILKDGILSLQGCAASIDANDTETVTLTNGTSGYKRTDLIVARYELNTDTAVESVTLAVIEGTPAESDPETPSYNEGTIADGDSPVDFPLYKVNIDGVSIDSLTQMFTVLPSISDLNSNTVKDIRVIEVSVSITINASTSGTKTATYTIPDGYKVVMFGGCTSSNTTIVPAGVTGLSGTATFRGRNTSSSSQTTTLTAILLCFKS